MGRVNELWSSLDERQLTSFQMGSAVEEPIRALLAVSYATDEQATTVRTALGAMAREVRELLNEGDPPDVQAAALLEVVVGVAGMRTRLDSMHRASAAQLTSVMQTGTGHPSLLAAIYCDVGRRSGLQVDAVAQPGGPILVRVGGDRGVLIDPSGGELADLPDGVEATLAPVRFQALVGPVLQHLISRGVDEGDLVEVFRLTAFACALHPEFAQPRLQRAAIAEQLGARSFAQRIYQDIAKTFPGTQASTIAAQRLEETAKPVPVH